MALGGRDLRRTVCSFRSLRGFFIRAQKTFRGDRAPLQVPAEKHPLRMSRAIGFRVWQLAFLLLCGFQAPASAAVEIAFYSRELGGNNFPHAFVALHGIVDSTGEQVNTSYGFTARSVTPAILFGSV